MAAHLMRRAGFGASNEELEVLGARPYDQIVDDLVNPEKFPEVDAVSYTHLTLPTTPYV